MSYTSPYRRLEAFLDGAPMRRRLRLAVVILTLGALAYLWLPAISKAVGRMHYSEYVQNDLDALYQKCQAGTLGFYENLDDEVGSAGSCHTADAVALNERKRTAAYSAARAELVKPVFRTVLLLIGLAAAWVLIPLVDRPKAI